MIGVNYTYYKKWKIKILKSYLLLFWYIFNIIQNGNDIDENNIQKIIKKIKTNSWRKNKLLIKKCSNDLFDNILIKKLLILAYEYEIEEKLLFKKRQNNIFRNNRIISVFNKLYNINFRKETQKIKKESYQIKLSKCEKEIITKDGKEEIKKFFDFIVFIFKKSGYIKESKKILTNLHKIKIVFTTNNSSFVKEENNNFIISLNNKKKTTLYHECTHVIQKIIKNNFWNQNKDFDLHSHNEWLANFFAYNLYNNIESNSLTSISLKKMFFPKYNYLYKKIIQEGANSKEKNQKIIEKYSKKLGYTNKEEIINLQDRFFKFFSLQQHNYLYPKELLYQIWYERIIQSFTGKNKIKHIANLLLYKSTMK